MSTCIRTTSGNFLCRCHCLFASFNPDTDTPVNQLLVCTWFREASRALLYINEPQTLEFMRLMHSFGSSLRVTDGWEKTERPLPCQLHPTGKARNANTTALLQMRCARWSIGVITPVMHQERKVMHPPKASELGNLAPLKR
eukprot:jgi/Ulvmu1/4199/UM019_0178.1